MQFYRCRCGKKTMWGSMRPQDCQGCEQCHTTLAQAKHLHKELAPHKWKTVYNQNTGRPYLICINCSQVEPRSYKLSHVPKQNR